MSFDHGGKKSHNGDSMWTSYSDLFLGLSIIFLLLYVTASLRQGTDGVRQFLENKQLTRQNEDLKQQLKVYESLKQNYLETQAQQGEQETYDMLMKKLELLKEEQKEEKVKLRAQATENEKKEQALNQYQSIVRNIVNANVLAKARIKNRDTLITKKEDTIEEQSEEITDLEQDIRAKKAEISKGEAKIENLEENLENKLKDLERSYKARKMTERKFREKQEQLKRETEQKVAALEQQNEVKEQEVYKIGQQLKQTSTQLASTSNQLNSANNQLARVSTEKSQLEQELAASNDKFAAEASKIRGEYEAQKAREKAAFEGALARERLSGAEKAKREAGFAAEANRKAQELNNKLGALQGQYKAKEGELAGVKGELAKAQENLNARRKLADSIKGKFNAAGVRADVDGKSGDVLLSFDGEYFDTGNAKLKPGMKKVLEKAMPSYAQSLFEDPKIADKIENVEIVGFASPTFKGKVIDPTKLSGGDRDAVNFNLDLSYARARSIFDHVYTKMNFGHKQRLLPLVKVTGRSFLSDKDRAIAGDDLADACKKLDCAKKQTVIIKFKLKD
jgi:hypothetical protein